MKENWETDAITVEACVTSGKLAAAVDCAKQTVILGLGQRIGV